MPKTRIERDTIEACAKIAEKFNVAHCGAIAAEIRALINPIGGANSGHGHVRARPDGVKARCGGPSLCAQCAQDAAPPRLDEKGCCPCGYYCGSVFCETCIRRKASPDPDDFQRISPANA